MAGRREVVQRGLRAARAVPDRVDGTAAGRGEQPRPPRRLVPPERRQTAHDLHPRFRGHIVGGIGGDHPEVAQQRRVRIPPKLRERRLASLLCGDKGAGKTLADHRAEYRDIKLQPA